MCLARLSLRRHLNSMAARPVSETPTIKANFTTGALRRRPVAGGGAGGAQAPPQIFRLELNSATKVEFFY